VNIFVSFFPQRFSAMLLRPVRSLDAHGLLRRGKQGGVRNERSCSSMTSLSMMSLAPRYRLTGVILASTWSYIFSCLAWGQVTTAWR